VPRGPRLGGTPHRRVDGPDRGKSAPRNAPPIGFARSRESANNTPTISRSPEGTTDATGAALAGALTERTSGRREFDWTGSHPASPQLAASRISLPIRHCATKTWEDILPLPTRTRRSTCCAVPGSGGRAPCIAVICLHTRKRPSWEGGALLGLLQGGEIRVSLYMWIRGR
jgi:hypothetical protein